MSHDNKIGEIMTLLKNAQVACNKILVNDMTLRFEKFCEEKNLDTRKTIDGFYINSLTIGAAIAFEHFYEDFYSLTK